MRTTMTIDDDLFRDLRAEARRRGLPMRRLVDTVLRSGLRAEAARGIPCPSFSMGTPTVDLVKASAFAAQMEDAEVVAEVERRE